MDEKLEEMLAMAEWVQENAPKKAVEHDVVLRKYSDPVWSKYKDALIAFDKESGFASGSMNGRRNAQRAVLKVFSALFKYAGPRKTETLDISLVGEHSPKKLTIGEFGFGLKRTEKGKSVRVQDWSEVIFILLNAEAICGELRKRGHVKMAQMLERLNVVVPKYAMMDYPVFVHEVLPRKVIGARGVTLASKCMMQMSMSGVRWFVEAKNKDYQETISLGGSVMEFRSASSGGWMVAFAQFQDVLPLVADVAMKKIEEDRGKIRGMKDVLNTEFGNYLLGVAL